VELAWLHRARLLDLYLLAHLFHQSYWFYTWLAMLLLTYKVFAYFLLWTSLYRIVVGICCVIILQLSKVLIINMIIIASPQLFDERLRRFIKWLFLHIAGTPKLLHSPYLCHVLLIVSMVILLIWQIIMLIAEGPWTYIHVFPLILMIWSLFPDFVRFLRIFSLYILYLRFIQFSCIGNLKLNIAIALYGLSANVVCGQHRWLLFVVKRILFINHFP
jgi:hypothetical protein